MATVAELIKQLQKEHNPNETVMFQYLVADHTPYTEEEFSQRLDEVNNYVYDELSNTMLSYLEDVELEEDKEDDED